MTTATHPAEAGFLREIIANPQSDADRLIFADWLEEHGQPERGEFIRVQCELWRGEWRDQAALGVLRRREREIVEKYGETWVVELLANAKISGTDGSS